MLHRDHGGRLPRSVDALRALPGVGPYTAAAVASLAFGVAEPAVDGNVARVAARLENDPRWLHDPRARARVVERLRSVVRGRAPGAVNEALIELGATVCTPRAPACERCPVSAWCTARVRRTVDRVPLPRAARAVPTREVLALWIERNGRVLLRRRPREGVLGGLWGLPMAEQAPGERSPDAARRAAGAPVHASPREVAKVEHWFTHKRWRVSIRRATLAARTPRGPHVRWCTRRDAFARATSTLDTNVLHAAWEAPVEAARTIVPLK
jgi:A/G-specific adenine glycosylase